MEVPPGEQAKLRWSQARAAAKVGAASWQNGQNVASADIS